MTEQPPQVHPSEKANIDAEHREQYDKGYQDLLKRQLSNNENFDKGILTLASGGLALTVAFLGNLHSVTGIALLIICWLSLFISVLSTLGSYLASQKGISIQQVLLQKYHVQRDDSALEVRNWAAELNEVLAWVSAGGFAVGILFLLMFFGINSAAGNIGKKPVSEVATQATLERGMTIQNVVQLRDLEDLKSLRQQKPNALEPVTAEVAKP